MRIGMSLTQHEGYREAKDKAALQNALNPAAMVEHLAGLGVRHFELSADALALTGSSFLPEQVSLLCTLQQRYALTFSIHMPFRVVDLSYPSRLVAQGAAAYFADIIQSLRPLEALAYVVHPASSVTGNLLCGLAPEHPAYTAYADTLAYALEQIIALSGIPANLLALENVSVPIRLNEMALERVPVSLCLDQGHVYVDRSGDALGEFELLNRYFHRICAVHLHNVKSDENGQRDHQRLSDGVFDCIGFINLLYRRNYPGYVVIEAKADPDTIANDIITLSETYSILR